MVVVVEPLEGRALLTTLTSALPPATPAAAVAPIDATTAIHVDGAPVNPAAVHQTVVRQAARNNPPPNKVSHPATHNASAGDILNVGKRYAQLVFASSTRQVGLSYIKAALRGDGKTLKNLGHTNAVKRVGQQFANLGRTSQVKSVGNSFANFGKSVYQQYHKTVG